MKKRCEKCGNEMKFAYNYQPGKFCTANYYCPKCEGMKQLIKLMRKEGGYYGDKRTTG